MCLCVHVYVFVKVIVSACICMCVYGTWSACMCVHVCMCVCVCVCLLLVDWKNDRVGLPVPEEQCQTSINNRGNDINSNIIRSSINGSTNIKNNNNNNYRNKHCWVCNVDRFHANSGCVHFSPYVCLRNFISFSISLVLACQIRDHQKNPKNPT